MPAPDVPLAGLADSAPAVRSAGAKGRSCSKLPGGNAAIGAFVVSLVAFTAQSEVAGYVQQSLKYKKPFLSLWLGHSGFMLLLPMHLLFLRWVSHEPTSHHLHRIAQNLHWQLNHLSHFAPSAFQESMGPTHFRGAVYRGALEKRFGFNPVKLFLVFSVLTLGITVPALSWYSAVPMTSMANITAIYNTFSVWALVFSVWFLGDKWQKRNVFSVLLACGGVIIVAYGGAEYRRRPLPSDPSRGQPSPSNPLSSVLGSVPSATSLHSRAEDQFTNPVLGAILALVGAVTMAMYEMAFKVVGTLPDETAQKERYAAVPSTQRRRSRSYIEYRAMPDDEEGLLRADEERPREEQQHIIGEDNDDQPDRAVLDTPSGERAAIWTEGDDEARTYQTIPSPAPRTSTDLPVVHKSALKTEAGEANGKANTVRNSVRIQEGVLVDSDTETESELEDGEEEEIQRGFTRLQRTRSTASVRISTGETEGPVGSRPRLRTRTTSSISTQGGEWIPAPLPFGLHANLMTSGIGFVTFTVLWLGIPIAHYLDWERFELPPDLWTAGAVIFVVLAGIVFNSTFAILLSLWGPVLASVACLMTTLLVVVADSVLGHSLSWMSVGGCVLIAAGFAVLVSAEAEGH